MNELLELFSEVKSIPGIFDYFDVADIIDLHRCDKEIRNILISGDPEYPIEFNRNFIRKKLSCIQLYWKCFHGFGHLFCGDLNDGSDELVRNIDSTDIFNFLSFYRTCITTIVFTKNIDDYDEYKKRQKSKTYKSFHDCLNEVTTHIYLHFRSKCSYDVEIIEHQEKCSPEDRQLYKMLLNDNILKFLNSHDRLSVFEAFHRTLSVRRRYIHSFIYSHIPNYRDVFEMISIYQRNACIGVVTKNGYEFYCEYLADILTTLMSVEIFIKHLRVICTEGGFISESIRMIYKMKRRWRNLETITFKITYDDNIIKYKRKLEFIDIRYGISTDVIGYYGIIANVDKYNELFNTYPSEKNEVTSVNIANETFENISINQFVNILSLPNLEIFKLFTSYRNLIINSHCWDFLATINEKSDLSAFNKIETLKFVNNNPNDIRNVYFLLNELKNLLVRQNATIDKLIKIELDSVTITREILMLLYYFKPTELVLHKCVLENEIETHGQFLHSNLAYIQNISIFESDISVEAPLFNEFIHKLYFKDCTLLNDAIMNHIFRKCCNLQVSVIPYNKLR